MTKVTLVKRLFAVVMVLALMLSMPGVSASAEAFIAVPAVSNVNRNSEIMQINAVSGNINLSSQE